MRLILIFSALLLFSCSSTQSSIDKEQFQVKEAWYNQYVGGTKEAGITNEFHIFTSYWPSGSTADSLCWKGQCIALRELEDGHLTSEFNYRPGQKAFNAEGMFLKVTDKDQIFDLPLDSIYLKERLILP